jgi:hypothetical protein
MSLENLLWGAPRIHGELLKLGFQVAQSTVAKYMPDRHDRPPGQRWWTFLSNHMPEIAAMDLFVVPTLAFKLLHGFVILRLDRRDIVWIGVTTSPTAEWIARQIRGFSLGFAARVLDPRPGLRLWLNRKAAPPCDGHSGQTHCALVALAKRLCRTTDWVHSPRMLGPHHCLW